MASIRRIAYDTGKPRGAADQVPPDGRLPPYLPSAFSFSSRSPSSGHLLERRVWARSPIPQRWRTSWARGLTR